MIYASGMSLRKDLSMKIEMMSHIYMYRVIIGSLFVEAYHTDKSVSKSSLALSLKVLPA